MESLNVENVVLIVDLGSFQYVLQARFLDGLTNFNWCIARLRKVQRECLLAARHYLGLYHNLIY